MPFVQHNHLLAMDRLANQAAAVARMTSTAGPIEWDADLDTRITRETVKLVIRAAHLEAQAITHRAAIALGHQARLPSPDILVTAAFGFIIIGSGGQIKTETAARAGKAETEASSNFSVKSSQRLLALSASGKQALREVEPAPARLAVFSSDREITIQAQIQTGAQNFNPPSHLMIVMRRAFSKIIIAIDAEHLVQ